MVQMHCIDMNAWYSRVDKPDRPDYVVFDLDPPDEPDGFDAGDRGRAPRPRAARRARAPGLREDERRRRHPRRSRRSSAARPSSRRTRSPSAASRLLERRHPGKVTTEWLKKKRSGVLVDHRQNGWGKTIASVYSVRPKPGAPVSTPLRWEELTPDVRPRRVHDGGRARAGRASTATCSRRCSRTSGRSARRQSGSRGSRRRPGSVTLERMGRANSRRDHRRPRRGRSTPSCSARSPSLTWCGTSHRGRRRRRRRCRAPCPARSRGAGAPDR